MKNKYFCHRLCIWRSWPKTHDISAAKAFTCVELQSLHRNFLGRRKEKSSEGIKGHQKLVVLWEGGLCLLFQHIKPLRGSRDLISRGIGRFQKRRIMCTFRKAQGCSKKWLRGTSAWHWVGRFVELLGCISFKRIISLLPWATGKKCWSCLASRNSGITAWIRKFRMFPVYIIVQNITTQRTARAKHTWREITEDFHFIWKENERPAKVTEVGLTEDSWGSCRFSLQM